MTNKFSSSTHRGHQEAPACLCLVLSSSWNTQPGSYGLGPDRPRAATTSPQLVLTLASALFSSHLHTMSQVTIHTLIWGSQYFPDIAYKPEKRLLQ